MFDEEKHRTHNSTYTQVGVQCFFESEVLNPSSVFLMKFSAKNPHLRVAAKRWHSLSRTVKMTIMSNLKDIKSEIEKYANDSNLTESQIVEKLEKHYFDKKGNENLKL